MSDPECAFTDGMQCGTLDYTAHKIYPHDFDTTENCIIRSVAYQARDSIKAKLT